MVEAYAGHHRNEWGDDVGRVEASAHAHLDDGYVDFGVAKGGKGHSDRGLKKTQLELNNVGTVCIDEVSHPALGNEASAHPKAFAQIEHVGRGVQADHLACFVKDAGEHVAGGTLTVGSGHVDAGVGELGITEPL